MCVWCSLMLSDKGLKLQRGGASTVGGVFPPEVMTILKPVCVCVLQKSRNKWSRLKYERCKDVRVVSPHAKQKEANFKITCEHFLTASHWAFHRDS